MWNDLSNPTKEQTPDLAAKRRAIKVFESGMCPNCESKIEEDWVVCPYCGYDPYHDEISRDGKVIKGNGITPDRKIVPKKKKKRYPYEDEPGKCDRCGRELCELEKLANSMSRSGHELCSDCALGLK